MPALNTESTPPYELETVRIVVAPETVARVADGMGEQGDAARALIGAELVPPDILAGMTRRLLAGQPGVDEAEAAAFASSLWVREQVTIHAPLRIGQQAVVRGVFCRYFVRAGRRYRLSTSETRTTEGTLLVSSCSTGLVDNRVHEGLEDGAQGAAPIIFGPDFAAASTNTERERLQQANKGEVIDGGEVTLSVEMMRAREASHAQHTDSGATDSEPKASTADGLHLLSFVQAAMMSKWGMRSLLHGCHFDVVWRNPAAAGSIHPTITVTKAVERILEFGLKIRAGQVTLMDGVASIPLVDE